MRTCFGATPYYAYYIDKVEQIINSKSIYLIDLTMSTMQFLVDAFDLDFPKSTEEFIFPKACLGLDLRYDDSYFSGKKLSRFATSHEYYRTLPSISALDALFNLGPEVLDVL